MAKLSIDKVKAGMVVLEKVATDKGMVILQPGAVLSDALIARLKKWGVQLVAVDDRDGSAAVPETSPGTTGANASEILAQKLSRLQTRFTPVLDDKVMATVYEAVQIHIKRQTEGIEEQPS